MELTCPKCRSAMRQYERSGIVVDQCESCRGIFLDRGELEKLVDAENRYHTGPAPSHTPPPPPPPPHAAPHAAPYGAPPPPPPAPHGGWHGNSWHGHHYRGHRYGRGHKRRRSFMEGLFD